MENYSVYLQNIGLTENESSIYLELVKESSITAYQIAKRTNIKRPTVYVTLEELRQKGLVLKVPHAKKQLFIARDLEEYLEEKEQKLAQVRTAMPAIKQLRRQNQPKVLFYEGEKQVIDSLQYRLEDMRGKEFVSFYGKWRESTTNLYKAFEKWDAETLTRGISFKVTTAIKAQQEYFKDLRQKFPNQLRVKDVDPETHPIDVFIEIGDGFIRIIDGAQMQAVIIDNQKIADSLKQIMLMNWQNA